MNLKTTEARHPYANNPTTPGTCLTCGRADPGMHNLIHKLPDVPEQAEHRRRAGESETEE